MNRSGGTGFAAAAVIAALSVTVGVFAATAAAGTLDRIGQDKSIRIAYRDDAPPISTRTRSANPVASWSICAARSPKSSPTSCIWPRST
jgi:ABC-type amino acid transport substrate-binding protein